MKKRIIVTGGSGRFGSYLKNIKINHDIFFPQKKIFNILNPINLKKYLKKTRADTVIHLAGLSRPMSIHEKDIKKSIDLNIIGTANITKVCSELNIKLIYFSTHYVYPGVKGNYSEKDNLLPVNNYALSKLGGECAVKLYKNSLILRITMCEKPFIHESAFYDVNTNFIFHDEVVKFIPKILNKKGILNVGGKTQSVYNFARKTNMNVKKISGIKLFPANPSMNISKLKKIIKKI